MAEKKKIAIIGAGGLGVPAAWNLINCNHTPLIIDIFDPDNIELSNLNRQVLFSKADVTRPKATVLKERLLALSSLHQINSFNCSITKENIEEALTGVDFVIDATDSIETKFLINDYCVVKKIPFCYAGAVKTQGQLLLVNPKIKTNGCLRCLFGDFSLQEFSCQDSSCQEAGILGPVVSLIGAKQAELCLQFLVDSNLTKIGSIFYSFNLETLNENEINVPPCKDCLLSCGEVFTTKSLDLRSKKCPQTFLYTKLALEQTKHSEQLEVFFSDAESSENVLKSTKEEGYLPIGEKLEIAKNLWRILIHGK